MNLKMYQGLSNFASALSFSDPNIIISLVNYNPSTNRLKISVAYNTSLV